MPYRFTDPTPYRYTSGSLFLGLDPATGQEIGIETERHAITVAGSGGGKGAGLIIPNLRRWSGAALVIDPKGENAEETWTHRQAMGQKIGVLDPFKAANIPDELRVSFNPLDLIEHDGFTAREDVQVIADGIVKRSNPRDALWDDGAASIIAGIIAYTIADAPPEHRTLKTARAVLLQDKEHLYKDAQHMLDCNACGGLAKAAGISIMAALEADKGTDKEFLAGARRHSSWIDSVPIASAMSSSSFDLDDIANDKATLYLVLPYRYMETHAAFLRLFVRTVQNALAAAGNKRGNKCLFILDEFFTLGKIDEIAKSAGNMRSYGLQLWPFLQDIGQLQTLYGKGESETFFGNADAHIFFANNDHLTLQTISDRVGRLLPNEVVEGAAMRRNFDPKIHWQSGENLEEAKARVRNEDDNAISAYAHKMRETGSNRLTSSDVAKLVGKGTGDKVARSMIVFAKQGDILNLLLSPYFPIENKAVHETVSRYIPPPPKQIIQPQTFVPPARSSYIGFGLIVLIWLGWTWLSFWAAQDEKTTKNAVIAFSLYWSIAGIPFGIVIIKMILWISAARKFRSTVS